MKLTGSTHLPLASATLVDERWCTKASCFEGGERGTVRAVVELVAWVRRGAEVGFAS